MSDKAIINRLLQFDQIKANVIGIDVINKYKEQGVKEINHYLQDMNDITYHEFTKEENVGRILYFINHPNKITPILIDNFCNSGMPSSEAIIVDGTHRLSAAIYLGLNKIDIEYSGLECTLDYLTGKIDKNPYII